MLYELRVYDVMPGRLPDLNHRFTSHAVGMFEKHGIGLMGVWTDYIGASNQLTFILTYDSMADRETRWNAFQADPVQQRVRSQPDEKGPLVSKTRNTFMRLTAYSPEPKGSAAIQELRIYDSVPGKMQNLHDRFSNHTLRLFERHGIENIAYWTDEVGTNNRLLYMLGYSSVAEREKRFDAFQADPEWQRARVESEVDGALVLRAHSTILKPTEYSPRS